MNTTAATTTISCPRCKQSIPAKLEQLLDVGADPEIKQRLLSGKINVIECPLCSFHGIAATPMVYHDPEKELLLTYTPVELALPLPEKERILGAITRAVIDRIPTENRKGYLLQPKEILSMEGLINAVLAGEGITSEMIENQRTKTRLLQTLATAPESDLPDLIAKNDEQIDAPFFQLLTALKAQSHEAKDNPLAPELEKIEQQLFTHSTFGKKTRLRFEALQTAATQLEDLGKDLTREKFVELVATATEEHHVTSLITLARPAADYEFFILLTEQIEKSTGDERARLEATRALVLETVQKLDAAAEERAKAAADVLQTLLHSEDLAKTVEDHLHLLDETLMMMLQHNLEEARKEKVEETVSRLEEVRTAIMQALHESAPPEIQLVNELLALETDEEAETMLRRRASEINGDTLDAMKRAGEQLRSDGQTERADKLDSYRAVAEKELTAAKWR